MTSRRAGPFRSTRRSIGSSIESGRRLRSGRHEVVLTELALADLDDIADWIGRDDWDRAEAFVETLRRRCASLARHPRRHPVVPGPGGREVRKLTHRGYLIVYRVLDRQVDIVRVLHGARDWAALLGEDE